MYTPGASSYYDPETGAQVFRRLLPEPPRTLPTPEKIENIFWWTSAESTPRQIYPDVRTITICILHKKNHESKPISKNEIAHIADFLLSTTNDASIASSTDTIAFCPASDTMRCIYFALLDEHVTDLVNVDNTYIAQISTDDIGYICWSSGDARLVIAQDSEGFTLYRTIDAGSTHPLFERAFSGDFISNETTHDLRRHNGGFQHLSIDGATGDVDTELFRTEEDGPINVPDGN